MNSIGMDEGSSCEGEPKKNEDCEADASARDDQEEDGVQSTRCCQIYKAMDARMRILRELSKI